MLRRLFGGAAPLPISNPVFSMSSLSTAEVLAVDVAPVPAILSVTDLSKAFGTLRALDGVTLDVRGGEVHCLLGENGAGKSTLCNLIFGVYQPTEGEIRLDGVARRFNNPAESLAGGISMVHQHFSVIGRMSVVENLMMGQVKGRLNHRAFADRIRELSDAYDLAVEPMRRIETLSVGERQRVEILKAMMREPRLLVLDEPTAVLPPLEIDALLSVCRKVADSGRGVLLVTHKLAEIATVADRVTVLRAGRVTDRSEEPRNDMPRLVQSMVGREISLHDDGLAAILGARPEQGGAALRGRRASPAARGRALTIDAVSYRNQLGVQSLDNITIEIAPGEIVGLAGVEGNGQSELSLILAGLMAATTGRIFVGGKDVTRLKPRELTASGVGIVPEDRHATGCIVEMSVAENLFLGRIAQFQTFGILRRREMNREAAAIMEQHDVRASGPSAAMSSLSGGNQQKAVLARELAIDPLVFLLAAQPTRGLDVGAVSAVYRRIRSAAEGGTGVLLVSSELDELISVADRILVIFRGGIVGEQPAAPSAREAIGRLMAGNPQEATLGHH